MSVNITQYIAVEKQQLTSECRSGV